jgi:hypothetical protein
MAEASLPGRAEPVPRVGASLAALRDRSGSGAAEVMRRLRHVEGELETRRMELERIQSAIDELTAERDRLRALAEAPLATATEPRQAVLAALTQQVAAVERRAAVVQRIFDRDGRTQEALDAPDLAPLLDEHQQFKQKIEPTLTALPESYRGVVLQHHASVCRRLRASVAASFASIVPLAVPKLDVDVVFSVDSTPDAELLAIVVPVEPAVYENWADRAEDLQGVFAARVVQAIYLAMQEQQLVAPAARMGGHAGLLAIELDLDEVPEGFSRKLGAAIERVTAAAPEIFAAGLVAHACEVAVEHLLPEDVDVA